MSARAPALGMIAMLACGTAVAQTINTYVQSPSGPNTIAYGLPVPLPVESLTPVDGFRSYASLEARLQGLALASSDLSAHEVGRSIAGRPLWAYVVGDDDALDVEGRPEAAFFINATTHAREWAAPEVSTGTIEHLLAHADDGGLVRYLLDNTRLVIVPVHNVDGLLQTQRYPTQTVIGGDPDYASWPRDGRMRRKNMRGADEVLTTLGDRLAGIDLNRNHPPFWSLSTSSSGNPVSLLYHGASAHSEPENAALVAAAQLAPVSRLRLGIDVHSFSRVFYSSNTGRSRLNAIQRGLIQRLRDHQRSLSGADYEDVPDPPNRGMGVAAEYFAYQWLVPAWTLELEPRNGPQDYGGLNANHGGFILPASEARRVRESWAHTHAMAFYTMAGPPHLARLRAYDADSGALVLQWRWVYGDDGKRTRSGHGAFVPGRRHRVELAFNKPMRHRDAGGAIAELPGVPLFRLDPVVSLVRGESRLALDVGGGQWLDDPQRVLRYRDDSFAFEFTAPADAGDYVLEVAAVDMTGTPLDADPSTPADWSSGAWSNWEDETGVAGDRGGADRLSGAVSVSAAPGMLQLQRLSAVAAEGGRVQLRARRDEAGPQRVELLRVVDAGVDPAPVASWASGEAGARDFSLALDEDLIVQGDREHTIELIERIDGTPGARLPLVHRVLDNDRPDRRVWGADRAGSSDATDLPALLEQVSGHAVPVDVVLARDMPLVAAVTGEPARVHGASDLTVFGNGAELRFDTDLPPRLVAIDRDASLRIDALTLRDTDLPEDASASAEANLFRIDGSLRVERSWIVSFGRDLRSVFDGAGQLLLRRSSVGMVRDAIAVFGTGLDVGLHASSVLQTGTGSMLEASGRNIVVERSTLAYWSANSTPRVFGAQGHEVLFTGSLLQGLVGGQMMDPPGPTCGEGVRSGGFNLHDRSECPFTADGDLRVRIFPVPQPPVEARYLAPEGQALDLGGDCTGVDQRGAPRPQRSSAAAAVACDAGAIEAGINPYRGIWQPERSGHGIELHSRGNQLLLVWYTYGDDGLPTSYQALAPLTGPRWEAELLQPRRDVHSGAIGTPVVGRVTLDFASDTDATLGWRFDAHGTNGSERIRPALFAQGEPAVEVTGVWYAPTDSGWGATVTRRGTTTALVLYYYDAQGRVRWVLGAGGGAAADEIAMQSFTGFCPDCDAAAMPVIGRDAGHVLAHFLTPERARFDTRVAYPGAGGGEWIRDAAALVPLNDPVDNREASSQLPLR